MQAHEREAPEFQKCFRSEIDIRILQRFYSR